MNIAQIEKRTVTIGMALIPLTVLSLYIVYGSVTFSRWPWFRFSPVESVLTCLWPFALTFNLKEDNYGNSLTALFIILIFGFDFLLMFPGLETLRFSSDWRGITAIIVLAIIHGIGFHFIEQAIPREIKKGQRSEFFF